MNCQLVLFAADKHSLLHNLCVLVRVLGHSLGLCFGFGPGFVAAFQGNLPGTPIVCESVLESRFFDRTFDAVLSIGLMFLLKAEEQHRLIRRFADILAPGGRLLFTSTAEPHIWNDAMTGLESISLGAKEYRKLLGAADISVAEEYEDVGENHYFDAFKGK
jgi:SAM-dependent methyltransferase